jgi:hypothetical protein
MSHTSNLKTQITDIKALEMACKELGLTLIKNGVCRGYNGNTITGDYVIKLKGPYDVALDLQSDNTYLLRTDWWAGHVAKEIGENAGRLLMEYGIAKATLTARKMGHMVSRKKLPNGNVTLVVNVR